MFDGNLTELKEKLKDYAYSIGISKIGFTDTKPLTEHLDRLIKRKEAAYKHAINEGCPQKRINPLAHMPEANTVISIAVAYPVKDVKPDEDVGKRGRFSLISRGKDYHLIIEDKLEKLKQFILSKRPGAKVKTAVDKDEILEKAIAVKAGLGWFGKNTLLVTPEYGSMVCLGEIITDLKFPVDAPLDLDCGKCRKCLDACPTGAIDEGKNLDLDKCIAGLTQSKILPDEEVREKFYDSLYGCDICQLVCPYNKRVLVQNSLKPEYELEDAYPLLKDILKLSNAEFRRSFGHMSGAWRGRTPIQRNAAIAAGNLGDTASVPELVRILEHDPRAVLRGAAAWALGKIGAEDGIKALERALGKEKDPGVILEIKNSLK